MSTTTSSNSSSSNNSNPTIAAMLAHRSIRRYTDDAVREQDILEPDPFFYTPMLRIWAEESGINGMPDSIESLIFPNGPSGAYSAPTCVADLTPGSSVQQLLEGSVTVQRVHQDGSGAEVIATSSYPEDPRDVLWFALVGTSPPNAELLTGGALTLLLINEVTEEELGIDYGQLLSLQAGDLIVPEPSQRNSASSFHQYLRHSHSSPLSGYHETASPFMAAHAYSLLSSFPNSVRLPQFVDETGVVATELDTEFGILSVGDAP